MKPNSEHNKKMMDGETELFRARIFRVVNRKAAYSTDRGAGFATYEIVERSPGIRAIVVRGNEILMIRELRTEHNAWDLRLPGGKVFDSLPDYLAAKDDNAIESIAEEAVVRELREEVGIYPTHKTFLYRSVAGATVTWDLLYYEVDTFEFASEGPSPGDDEIIQTIWMSLDQVADSCLKGDVKEDRTAALLLRYVLRRASLPGSVS